MPEKIDELLVRLFDAIRPAADVFEMNGPSGYMFGQVMQEMIGDKPVGLITLDEVAEGYRKASERYAVMCNRLNALEGNNGN